MEYVNIDKFLEQDRYTFDQDKEKGRRSLMTNYTLKDFLSRKDEIRDIFEKQSREVIKIILSYHKKHKDKLHQDESLLLLWHAGQSYAMCGSYKKALELFKQTLDIQKIIGDRYGVGLAYIESTIAFLKGDGYRLEDIAKTIDKRAINYSTVQRLYNGFKDGKSYFDSYSGL